MIRDKAVDLLMGRLGQRTSTVLQQAIIDEMVFAQEVVLEGRSELPWFLLSESATEGTIPNEERVPIPADFLIEWEEGGLYLQESDGTETLMEREDWDVLKAEPRLEGTGKPTFYDLAGDYYLLRKIPDAVYTLKMRYYQKDASLTGAYGDTSNIENVWLAQASDWLIAETGVIIASQRLQSEKMANMFMKQSDLARKRVMNKHTARIESNKNRIMDA